MSPKINAIIIDDEQNFVYTLEILLNQICPEINIIGYANTVSDSIKLLKLTNPNLVFLDINLTDGTAFEILEKIENRNFEIIFTTSFSNYALQAFEFSALHYLIKPITAENLQEALNRFYKAMNFDFTDDKISILKESFLKKSQKILLASIEGMSIYNISDIVRCESDSNYTKVFFTNQTEIVVSKPLQSFYKLLLSFDFVRIHTKHLVNLRFIKKYLTGRKPSIVLLDNTELPVSQTYRPEFSDRLKQYANTF